LQFPIRGIRFFGVGGWQFCGFCKNENSCGLHPGFSIRDHRIHCAHLYAERIGRSALASKKSVDSGTDSRVDTDVVSANSLRSGELASLTGVSADTLRHYERLGILPTSQRTDGGYRIFSASAVQRVQLAQRALQLGFSLNELSGILRTRDNGGVPCHRVLNLTEDKLRSLGQQITALQQTQSYMRKLVRDWKRTLKRTPPGGKAMLLHSLVDKPKTKSTTHNLKRRLRS
jgi:MerR family copper efflux transcriptional regulator